MQNLSSILPLVLESTCLRRLRAEDAAPFQAYRADSELAVYQSWSPMTLPEARAFIHAMSDVASLRLGDWIQLAIADARTELIMGDVGVFLEADGSVAELGFTLCRSAQGKGHATRAVRAAVALVHSASDAIEVRAVADARNTKSIRTLERAAFRRSHTREVVFKGEPCTEVVYVSGRASA